MIQLFIILFVVFAAIVVWYLDQILVELGFQSWLIDGKPGHENCTHDHEAE